MEGPRRSVISMKGATHTLACVQQWGRRGDAAARAVRRARMEGGVLQGVLNCIRPVPHHHGVPLSASALVGMKLLTGMP